MNVGVVRSAGAGRPRLKISEELLETLYTRPGFRWAGIARMQRVSKKLCGDEDMSLGSIVLFHRLAT